MSESAAAPYRVLARKYRPTDFSGLIGQEALVRTLTNAFRSGRVAHAFLLTGVRGVGKTTTARIIARALNCVGPDGQGGPTAQPCGVCPHCLAIAEDRDPDVLEMDAASRTSVNDIREILEGVRYRPVSARYKVYIIDEVHMLSANAFNALLKTLEEPPAHVKFVFATTDLRKLPVTVLSRCQRFDLRRVEGEVLEAHFRAICDKEGVSIEPGALALLARAADGSVRDGLSLLDTAIAHCGDTIAEAALREMLGLGDRGMVFDLFERLMKGDMNAALAAVAEQYALGVDPATILSDLLELTHWLTRIKLAPALAAEPGVAEAERVRGAALATALPMASLSRAWQMLLKGLGELRGAPSPLQAAEMVLVRLAYAADLPTPAEVIAGQRDAPSGGGGGPPSGGRSLAAATAATAPAIAAPAPVAAPRPATDPVPTSFAALLALCAAKREPMLVAQLSNDVHLVRYEPGRLEFRPGPDAPRELANRLSQLLPAWTGRQWLVAVSDEPGEDTFTAQKQAAEARSREQAALDPLVREILAHFPDAKIVAVRELESDADEDDGLAGAAMAPPEADEMGEFE